MTGLNQECQFCGKPKREHGLACLTDPFQGFEDADGYAGDRWVPQCQTCRWWDKETDRDPERGVCRLAEQDGSPISISGEGWRDELLTAPDFGCVQWEAKRDE